MFSKSLYVILKQFLNFLYKMSNNPSFGDNNRDRVLLYKFKPFCYEEIFANNQSKVPYPRSGHRIGADSANIYSFGGYNPLLGNEGIVEIDEVWMHSYPLFQELWRFNFARKEWVRYPNSHSLPMELASNALILHKNVLMVSSYVSCIIH